MRKTIWVAAACAVAALVTIASTVRAVAPSVEAQADRIARAERAAGL